MSHRFIKQGADWRVGWDPSVSLYKGLLAGQDWAVELTEPEFQDFCRLAQQLQATLQAMAPELMDAERIACEAESERIWLEAEGFPQAYGLRFIVLTGRRCEGSWPDSAVPEVLAALRGITLF